MIVCDQCGAENESPSKFCRKCGEPLEDEMRERVREAYTFELWKVVLAAVLAGVLVGAGLLAYDNATHFTWTQTVVSPVATRDTWTTTVADYCMLWHYSTGEGDSTYCIMWHYRTDTHWGFTLADGHHVEVDQATWDATNVGDAWGYPVVHHDWIPGMENAPVPGWVFVLPLMFFLAVALLVFGSTEYRRWREIREWRKTGDLEVR